MAVDPDDGHAVRENTRRIVGIATLRRLRAMVDREATDEAAIRRFTVRALLWLTFIALSVPLGMFAIGAVRVLLEYLAQGRPLAAYLARFAAESPVLLLWLPPWALALWALVRNLRRA